MGDELVIVVWDSDEVEELVNAWVSLLEVLGADEDAREPDQRHNIWSGLALEVLDAG